ncbi:hypothetical protein LOC68_05090 [Blastopirellula sp. JC732]|uniref:Uncharacterized protein n=1 Tax=Blastopirellula sediminis TaxID=2894196 RepID=A0A9X1SFQ2_9BACT|nr:hypothetical protein [Blastopirellula sediminis]MCC9609462.1 hypothetical protein [Blastopirellula sediminis]MCC9627761.1 hypothetical protein [Blastopirellula sediminis]
MLYQRCALLLSAAMLLVGCNNQNNPSVSENTGENVEVAPVQDPLAIASIDPKTAVESFLAALRDGDKELTSKLLTQKARQETRKHNLAIDPVGASGAKFEVGETIYITSEKRGAHVESHWFDVDPQGKAVSYDIVWIMRRETGGWRVAGMATELFAGEPPLVLPFENPAEMFEAQKLAEREILRRGGTGSSEVMPASHTARPGEGSGSQYFQR